MNVQIQDEESHKLHDEEEFRRYNDSKRKNNLKMYGVAFLIVILMFAYIVVGLYR